MKRLEGLRLEVDSRRRTVLGLRQAIDAKASKAQTPKGEFQTEQLIRKMQHKENKLASACPPWPALTRCAWLSVSCTPSPLPPEVHAPPAVRTRPRHK